MSGRSVLLTAAAALVLVVATPAHAKGPTGATITGPGIEEPIVIEGHGEYAAGGDFSAFVTAAGFWPLVGGVGTMHSAQGKVVDGADAGDLGPMYLVAWHLGSESDVVEAEVYPTAPGGPLVHADPDRLMAFGDTAPGGWFAAPQSLVEMLAGYGVPVHGTKAASVEPPAQEQTSAPAAMTPVPGEQRPVPPAGDASSGGASLPVAAVAAAAALAVTVVLWAMGRRPRRIGAP